MTNRIIKVLENECFITRGIHQIAPGEFVLSMKDVADVIPITVNWRRWLGSDTISEVTNSPTAATVSNASNTTTTASLTLSGGSGYVKHTITTAAGTVKSIIIWINEPGDRNLTGYC